MDDIDDEVDAGISEIDDVDIDELNDVSFKNFRRFRDVFSSEYLESVSPTILFFKDYNNTDDDDDLPDDQTDQ